MNAKSDDTLRIDSGPSQPLESLRAPAAALADLLFGSLNAESAVMEGGHLAILPSESLELDLSDPAQCHFGDYELREMIGKGGMGVVYRAHQTSLDREVAVKLLAAGPWASREFIERFRNEAQSAARMQHPNIVAIYEVGSADEMHYFSMRLVIGGSLASVLQRDGRMPALRAAQVLRTVAEAVDYAHKLGVLHLDLKPANVLLDEAGTPYVADFGLARRLEHGRSATLDEVSGTPSYMAPEQAIARAQKVTPATDIWGLGAILFELVTGRAPFLGATPEATLRLVASGNPPDPRDFVPMLHRDLAAIIGHCLVREAGRRYPSARALADDLSRFVEGRPVHARPLNAVTRLARWARREPKLAATAALAFVALAAGLVTTSMQWRNARNNAATASRNLWNARDDAALRYMESPDGWRAAPLLLANIREMEQRSDPQRLEGARKRLGILENNNPRLIDAWPVPPLAAAIAFSPDGTRLALSTEQSGVRGYDVASGHQSWALPHGSGGPDDRVFAQQSLQFLADNRTVLMTQMAFTSDAPLPAASVMRRLDAARGAWRDPPQAAQLDDVTYGQDGRFALLTDKDGRVQLWAAEPWSPQGALAAPPPWKGTPSRLLAPDGSVFAQDTREHAVMLVDAHTLKARATVDLGDFGAIAAWRYSGNSQWLALGDSAGAIVVVDLRNLTVSRPAPAPSLPIRYLAFSGDDGWLAAAADGGGVYLWSWPEGRLLAPPFAGNGSLSGAPSPQRVEVDRAHRTVLVAGNTDNEALWQVAPTENVNDRSDALPLTAFVNARSPLSAQAFAWAPTQGLLASVNVQHLRLERTPPPALKSGHAAPMAPGTVHFDGRWLAEVEGGGVRVVDARTERARGARIELPQPPSFAELTPDGRRVVVLAGPTLFAFDATSGRPLFSPIALPNTPTYADVSPDGLRVVVAWPQSLATGDHLTSEVAVIYRLADGALLAGPTPLPGMLHGLAFSPDGSRLAAWNRSDASVRDGKTLKAVAGPLGSYRPRGYGEDSRKGTLATVVFDDRQATVIAFHHLENGKQMFELRRFPATGGEHTTPLPVTDVHALVPLPRSTDVAIISNSDPTQIVAADGSFHALPELIDDTNMYAGAVSSDGRWYARGLRDGAVLFDLHQNIRMTSLRVALPRPDVVATLAFSPDGNRLLARSLRGRLLVWDLTPDSRPVAEIAREVDLRELSSTASGSTATPPPTAAERAAMRARDPGPLNTAAPSLPVSVRVLPGGGIPPRDSGLTTDQLDLTAAYSFGLRAPLDTAFHGGGDFAWLPQGRQRYLGIDFDVRGGIDLARSLNARFAIGGNGPTHAASDPIAAVDLLIGVPNYFGIDASKPPGQIRLDYADGSQATIALGFGERPAGYWRNTQGDSRMQFVAWGNDARDLNAYQQLGIVGLLRLPNPHPERPLLALTLVGPPEPDVHHAVLAITLERTQR
ncbi:MAG: protein kinase [Proteobacteria bacterium]|nr:protein kinase [Pseudomonadota bacterium]